MMRDPRTEAILKEAVRQARARGGLVIGQAVAHATEPHILELIAIEGETGIAEWEGVRLERPVSEFFDPNLARDIAMRLALSGLS